VTQTIERSLPPLPAIDDATRREFLIGAAGLLLLPAGCGSDGEDGRGSSGETRTVRHALGTTEVPLRPQRVITLDGLSLETMLALGTPPVATAEGLLERYEGIVDLGRIESIGGDVQPSLERIAALRPDLIFGEGTPGEGIQEIYDDLSRIAPTVAFVGGPEAGYEQGWKQTFRNYAGVLGRGEEAEGLLGDYEARARGFGERFREATGRRVGETTVSVIRFRPDAIRAYLASSFAGSVIEEAGLARPEVQRAKPAPPGLPFAELSTELIPEIDADHIFIFQPGDPEEETAEVLEDVRNNPLWGRLRAVRAGNVHEVGNDELWFEGTVIAAGAILDDLEKYLLDEQG